MLNLCQCDCGKECIARFCHGHNRRNIHHSEETKVKISLTSKGKIISKETREKLRLLNLGKKFSEEIKKKISDTKRKNNAGLGYKHTDESKRKMSLAQIGNKKFLDHHHTNEIKNRISSANSLVWNNLSDIDKHNRLARMMHAPINKPNKSEKKLINILLNLKTGFEYVGNCSFWIHDFNPDFVDRKNHRIIEMNGCHYHNCQICFPNRETINESERFEIFKIAGFNTLVIWEHELRNLVLVSEKIKFFMEC